MTIVLKIGDTIFMDSKVSIFNKNHPANLMVTTKLYIPGHSGQHLDLNNPANNIDSHITCRRSPDCNRDGKKVKSFKSNTSQQLPATERKIAFFTCEDFSSANHD